MKKKLGAILLVVALALALAVPAAQVAAHTEAFPQVQTLYAGQDIDVGTVSVWNDEVNLYVKYETTGGWAMTETHLHVATSLGAIPQTIGGKKGRGTAGNPIPGHFDYGDYYDPPETEDTFTIPLNGWVPCTNLYIAAHAMVVDMGNPIAETLVSDTQAMVTQRRAGNAIGFTPVSHNAFLAWEPGPLYPNDPTGSDPWDPSLWDLNTVPPQWFTINFPTADWIWESYLVQDPILGTVITLERQFNIDGYPMSGTLHITCDNGYEAFVNGTSVGSAQVAGIGWQLSNLKQPSVFTGGWQTIEHLSVSGQLQGGQNTLTIDAANEYFMTNDPGNPWPGTQSNNPGACIFALEYEYAPEETAWGEGTRFTPKGNWATYIEYHIQGPVLDWYEPDDSSAEWDTVEYHHGTQSAKLSIPVDYTINSYARVTMSLVCQDVYLDDITSLSYWYYVDPSTATTPGSTSVPGVYDGFIKTEAWAEPSGGGYADYDTYGGPYLIIELDADGDESADTWVIQAKWASDTRGSWLQDTIETTEPFHVVSGLTLTPSFPIGTNWGSLAEVKAAVVDGGPDTLGDAEVLKIKIAIGWWNPAGPTAPIGPVIVNVDEVEVNGLLLF